MGEAQFGSDPEIQLPVPGPWHPSFVRERLRHAIPRVFFSVSSLCFRRLNDPSVVTPFSRDDRGHTPLHVAALCGMWSWVGICGLSGQRDGAKGGPAEARLTGLGGSELAWWRGLLHGTPPGALLEEKVADGPQA